MEGSIVYADGSSDRGRGGKEVRAAERLSSGRDEWPDKGTTGRESSRRAGPLQQQQRGAQHKQVEALSLIHI